jgi:hypothetical protein
MDEVLLTLDEVGDIRRVAGLVRISSVTKEGDGETRCEDKDSDLTNDVHEAAP